MTDPRIIYPTDDGGVAVLIPAPEWLAQEGNSIEALAAKDVPPRAIYRDTGEVIEGAFEADGSPMIRMEFVGYEPRPWKIVDAADIPTDRMFRAAWEYEENAQ